MRAQSDQDSGKRGGLFRDQRGTASVEAAIMLPLLLACWLGVMYRAQTIDAMISAAAEARRNAWVISNDGCMGERLEGNCQAAGGKDAFAGHGALDALIDAPIVGFLFESILGYSTTVSALRTVDRPPLFGGGEVNLGYGYYLMCNERPIDMGSLLLTTACQQLSDTLGGLMEDVCPQEEARYPAVQCE